MGLLIVYLDDANITIKSAGHFSAIKKATCNSHLFNEIFFGFI